MKRSRRDIVLSKKKKRRVRSRLKTPPRSEAEEEGWQSGSDDSISITDSLTDTDLTTNEIAAMRGEIERILSEAQLSQKDASVAWPTEHAQPRQVIPLRPPLVGPAPRRDRRDTKVEEASIPVSKELPISSSNPGQRSDSVPTPTKELSGRWEPMNTTLLKDNFDEPLAARNNTGSQKIKQSTSSSDPAYSQSKSGAHANPYSTRSRVDAKSSSSSGAARGPPGAAAVDGRFCPWCSGYILPPVAGFQGGPVCDDCRFTCAGCGRRSPEVNFTTYCADCSRPLRPPRETCRICQDEYAHRLHDQDDPYCNCQRKGHSKNKQFGGNSGSKSTGDVPFVYSTNKAKKPSTARKSRTFEKQIGRPSARQVWTTSNTTAAGYPDINTSGTPDESPEEKPSSLGPIAATASTAPLPVSIDAQATLSLVPSPQHHCCCQPQLYATYGQPGYTACTTTTCYCSPPDPNTCYCTGIPGAMDRTVSQPAPVCSAAGTHRPQWPVFYTGYPPAPYPSPPPGPFQGTSFRREDTWTEGSTVRKVVMEETKQFDSLQQSAKPVPCATPMYIRGPVYASTPSQRSSAPTCFTSESSSWGRTLDLSPGAISRRCSYVSCVPQRSLKEVAWSTSRLGGPFSWSSANLRDVSRPESAPSMRKSSLKDSACRASISSVGSTRKLSSQQSEPPLDSADSAPGSRKSSLGRSETRSPFIFSVSERKPSIQGKPEPSTSASSSRKSSVKEAEKVALPPKATSSRKSSQQPVYDSVAPASGFDVSRRALESQKQQIKPSQALLLPGKPVKEMVSKATAPELQLSSVGVGTEQPSYAHASVGTAKQLEPEPPAEMAAARKEPLRRSSVASSKRLENRETTAELHESTFVTLPVGPESRRASTAVGEKGAVSPRKPSKLSTVLFTKSGEITIVAEDDEQRQAGTVNDDKSLASARKASELESDEISKIHGGAVASAEEPHESEGVERSVKESTEEAEAPVEEGGESPSADALPPIAGTKYPEEHAKTAEASLEDLFSTSRTLYPESRIVIALGILCILWVIAIILLSSVNHFPFPTLPTDTSPSDRFTVITVSTSSETTTQTTPATAGPTSTASTVITYSCSTPYCEREGEYLKSLLSSQREPCENFYEHVCDNWKSNALSNVQMAVGGAVSRDTMLEEQMEREVIDYFNSVNRDVLPALQLHQACIRSTQLPGAEATNALRDIFREYIGTTWPIPRSYSVLKHDHVWSLAGRLYREFGIDAFLAVAVGRYRNELPVAVLEGPQMLFFKEYHHYSNTNALFREAVNEAVIGLHAATINRDTIDDVYAVFNDLGERRSSEAKFDFTLSKVPDLPHGLRTFILVVFEAVIGANATVIVRSPQFILNKLPNYVRATEVPSLINYLGFRLLVRMAPFFPSSGFENIKRLFSLEYTGRVRPAPLDHSVLCLRAVEAALPICVVKAMAKVLNASGNDLTNRMWLSQIENSFFRNTALLSWVDELTYHVVRFRMAHTKLARFFPAWALDADQCSGNINQYGSNAVIVYRNLSNRRMNAKLGQIYRTLVPREPGFPFAMRSRYVWSQQATYVPLGLINSSVPNNATFFAFHLSRVAVRLFHSFAPLLREEPTSLGAPYSMQYSNRSLELLGKLLDCLSTDLENVLRSTRTEFVVDPDAARYALLAQTAALGLAFKAFRDLLHVERIWKMSFRLSSLPELSSDQLFFIYYALDNCENSDATYQLRQYDMWQRLPPELAVNFPLRYMPRFGEAFKCSPGSPMRPAGLAAVCDIFNGTKNYRSKL